MDWAISTVATASLRLARKPFSCPMMAPMRALASLMWRQVGAGLRLLPAFEKGARVVGKGADRGQRLVQFMGDAGRHLPQHGQLARLDQLVTGWSAVQVRSVAAWRICASRSSLAWRSSAVCARPSLTSSSPAARCNAAFAAWRSSSRRRRWSRAQAATVALAATRAAASAHRAAMRCTRPGAGNSISCHPRRPTVVRRGMRRRLAVDGRDDASCPYWSVCGQFALGGRAPGVQAAVLPLRPVGLRKTTSARSASTMVSSAAGPVALEFVQADLDRDHAAHGARLRRAVAVHWLGDEVTGFAGGAADAVKAPGAPVPALRENTDGSRSSCPRR